MRYWDEAHICPAARRREAESRRSHSYDLESPPRGEPVAPQRRRPRQRLLRHSGADLRPPPASASAPRRSALLALCQMSARGRGAGRGGRRASLPGLAEDGDLAGGEEVARGGRRSREGPQLRGGAALARLAAAACRGCGSARQGWVVVFVASYFSSTDVSMSFLQLAITIARCEMQ